MTPLRASVDGYVADVAYPSMFHQRFSPAWIDAVLLQSRCRPPRATTRDAFTMLDVGCGDGYGLIVNAAAYPEGRFVGIDASRIHIERGVRMVRALGLTNIELRHRRLDRVRFGFRADYVTAQGVLTWVSSANREALWALARRTLKPAGALMIGYNALPKWSSMLAFQRLLFASAMTLPGDSIQRFDRALELVRASGAMAPDARALSQALFNGEQVGYLAHEYLNEHWDCFWSGDVIAAAERHRLRFVTHGDARRNRDELMFSSAQRAGLKSLGNVRAREIAADLLLDCGFRCDVFTHDAARRLTVSQSNERRLDSYWMARRSEEDLGVTATMPAGPLTFDRKVAHAILRGLSAGPIRLRDIPRVSRADVLKTADDLFLTNYIHPVNAHTETPRTLAVNRRVFSQDMPVSALVTPHGAVLPERSLSALDHTAFQRMGLSILQSGVWERPVPASTRDADAH